MLAQGASPSITALVLGNENGGDSTATEFNFDSTGTQQALDVSVLSAHADSTILANDTAVHELAPFDKRDHPYAFVLPNTDRVFDVQRYNATDGEALPVERAYMLNETYVISADVTPSLEANAIVFTSTAHTALLPASAADADFLNVDPDFRSLRNALRAQTFDVMVQLHDSTAAATKTALFHNTTITFEVTTVPTTEYRLRVKFDPACTPLPFSSGTTLTVDWTGLGAVIAPVKSIDQAGLLCRLRTVFSDYGVQWRPSEAVPGVVEVHATESLEISGPGVSEWMGMSTIVVSVSEYANMGRPGNIPAAWLESMEEPIVINPNTLTSAGVIPINTCTSLEITLEGAGTIITIDNSAQDITRSMIVSELNDYGFVCTEHDGYVEIDGNGASLHETGMLGLSTVPDDNDTKNLALEALFGRPIQQVDILLEGISKHCLRKQLVVPREPISINVRPFTHSEVPGAVQIRLHDGNIQTLRLPVIRTRGAPRQSRWRVVPPTSVQDQVVTVMLPASTPHPRTLYLTCAGAARSVVCNPPALIQNPVVAVLRWVDNAYRLVTPTTSMPGGVFLVTSSSIRNTALRFELVDSSNVALHMPWALTLSLNPHTSTQ